MKRLSLILMSIVGLLTLAVEHARADGGQVRAVERQGDIEVIVFTSPTPMRASWADISVAVRNTATNESCDQCQVVVELRHSDPTVPMICSTASSEAATNKLLKAALVELPVQGSWQVTVDVETGNDAQPVEISFPMDVAAPWPAWLTDWPWFCWPVAPIALFIVHRAFVAVHPGTRRLKKCDVPLAKKTRSSFKTLPLPPGEGWGEGELPKTKAPSPCPLPRGEGFETASSGSSAMI